MFGVSNGLVLKLSQGVIDWLQQLKLQVPYQTTHNHSYTPYKEQDSVCVQFRTIVTRYDKGYSHWFKSLRNILHIIWSDGEMQWKSWTAKRWFKSTAHHVCVINIGFLVCFLTKNPCTSQWLKFLNKIIVQFSWRFPSGAYMLLYLVATQLVIL